MFTVTDTVANPGAPPITLAPYGSRRSARACPPTLGKTQIVHEGAIGTFGTADKLRTEQLKYKDWAKKPARPRSPRPAAGSASPTNTGWRP